MALDLQTAVGPATSLDSLASEVRHYLTETPRQLPSSALYDGLGSALFDAICELPWYPVTRAERRLIAAQRASIFEAIDEPQQLVELGCGNGEKLHLLLGEPGAEAIRAVRRIDLVDVSRSALAAASRLVSEGRRLSVVSHLDRYEEGLARATAARRPGERVAVLFLGSNIGNFDPPQAGALLAAIRAAVRPGDSLVIGADLVKPAATLLLAYDDPLGVTAAFNKNLLVHLNRELGATFEVGGFDHRAVWNAHASRVEMHLVSRRPQRVRISKSGLVLDLAAGEYIWTESSYKYDVDGFGLMLGRAGFRVARHWIDRGGQFLLAVAHAVGGNRGAL